jgi:hypothetical protein
MAGKERERAFRPFPSIFDHFLHFFEIRKWRRRDQREAVTWKELLRGKMPCRIRPAAIRTYSGQWTREEAAISAYRFAVQ